MFTRVPDASKAAFVTMVRAFVDWDIRLIDCQMRTEHLARFGAREIPRDEFVGRLRALVTGTPQALAWRLDVNGG